MSEDLKIPAEPGSWDLAMELLDRGDPAFVDELRNVRDADRLGAFARQWYGDHRPASRRLLFEYLDRPLNALRHEALVKRLFKLAEEAGDDEMMGRMMVAFDRSIRRQLIKRHRYDPALREWATGQMATTSDDAMPRPDPKNLGHLSDWQRRDFPRRRLFSIQTRQYLRRRAWRYFRKIGRKEPDRYRAALLALLPRYTEDDVKDGLAILDNWGMVHALFHYNSSLIPRPTGWVMTAGSSLADVKAEPYYVKVWKADAAPLLGLLIDARARAVRQWAIQMLERHHPEALAGLSLEQLVAWLGHPSSEMVALAVRLLRSSKELAGVEPSRLIRLLQNASAETLEMLTGLVEKVVRPEQVSIRDAVTLAKARQQVLAQFGFKLLQSKPVQSAEDCQAVLELTEAEAVLLRPRMMQWATAALSAAPGFQAAWVVEVLDSRHEDVRTVGWKWLHDETRAGQEVVVWQRLLESPYDDVRLKMIQHLEGLASSPEPERREMRHLSPGLVRFLWATVLLNVARGSKNKPAIVNQLLQRLDRDPGQADDLLPILGVALRSLRGPEFRAGLVGVVQWTRRHPGQEATVNKLFPELKLAPIAPNSVGPDWGAFLAQRSA